MVILLNCVTLGMYQPCENIDCTSDRCQILQVSWPAVFMCACVCTEDEMELNFQLFATNSKQLMYRFLLLFIKL